MIVQSISPNRNSTGNIPYITYTLYNTIPNKNNIGVISISKPIISFIKIPFYRKIYNIALRSANHTLFMLNYRMP